MSGLESPMVHIVRLDGRTNGASGMAVANSDSRPSGVRDWRFELGIGAIALLLGGSVWAYSHYSDSNPQQDKPKPAWLAVPKVMAQMSDGRMVNIKINLRLKDNKEISALEPYIPAFKALLEETGALTKREDLQARDGIQRFEQAVRTSFNDYLEDQEVSERVKGIAFEEMMLMP
jgi:flagellar basal body-associated protein FliL